MVTSTGIPSYTYVVSIGGSTTAVNQISGTAVLSNAATTSGASTLSITTFNAFLGINPNGATLIRDAFLVDGTNARVSYKAYGTHLAAFDTTSATLSYAWLMSPGQRIAFNVTDASIGYAAGALTYSVAGSTPLAIYQATNAVNGVGITPAATGFGPTLSPQGTDTNAPLNLSGKGTSAVQVVGPLAVSGQATFSGIVVDASYTVATAPAGVAGAHAYFTNARKSGEAAGNGTGVLAYFSNGAWRRLSDDTAIAA